MFKAATIGLMLILTSIAAFALPTLLTTTVLIQNNAQVTAGQLTVTPAACDTSNGNVFNATGREILLLQNTDTSVHSITITPVADPYGGTNTTLTSYSLPASSISMVQMKYLVGWQTSGQIAIAPCSSNLIKIAVVQYN
jgi:hypothetical protein